MTVRVVVSGMGVISPYGVGSHVLWDKLMAGETGLRALTSFDTSHVQCKVGGQLFDFRPEKYLSPRIVRKVDRFSTLGLISAQLALQDAGLLLADMKPTWSQQDRGGDRVGITVGNNLGGWEFAERELRHLWQSGPREVSPYMATAWFPAAVQGNISTLWTASCGGEQISCSQVALRLRSLRMLPYVMKPLDSCLYRPPTVQRMCIVPLTVLMMDL